MEKSLKSMALLDGSLVSLRMVCSLMVTLQSLLFIDSIGHLVSSTTRFVCNLNTWLNVFEPSSKTSIHVPCIQIKVFCVDISYYCLDKHWRSPCVVMYLELCPGTIFMPKMQTRTVVMPRSSRFAMRVKPIFLPPLRSNTFSLRPL